MVKFIITLIAILFIAGPLSSQKIDPPAKVSLSSITTPEFDSVGTWVVFPWNIHKKSISPGNNGLDTKILRITSTLKEYQPISSGNELTLVDNKAIVLDSLKSFRPRYALIKSDSIFIQIQNFAKSPSELETYAITIEGNKINLLDGTPDYITTYFSLVHLQIHNSLRLPPSIMGQKLNPLKESIWPYNLRKYRFSIIRFHKWWNSINSLEQGKWKPVLRGQ